MPMMQTKPHSPAPEPVADTPVESGEQWLGRGGGPQASRRRLWERLNPRHRKTLRLLGRALALHQSQARLPEPTRAKLLALLDELERLALRIEKLLAAVATQTPPQG